MICPNCGKENENAGFCVNCGAQIPAAEPQRPASVPTYATPPRPTPQPAAFANEYDLPERYRPMSPWAYFGLTILFSIPIVGFVFLIVFSFNGSNINRRNFARSYWCGLLVAVILIVVIAVFAAITGGSLYALLGV